jgi:hypothetical protein
LAWNIIFSPVFRSSFCENHVLCYCLSFFRGFFNPAAVAAAAAAAAV